MPILAAVGHSGSGRAQGHAQTQQHRRRAALCRGCDCPDPDALAGACAESAWSPSSQADSENRLATSISPGGATATLGLRIYLSDVVVRARFVSGGDGKFSFRAIEYLKGSGSSDFEVIDERAGGNPKWSLHEAVLLLSMPEEDEETLDPGDATKFIFTDTVAQNYEEYGNSDFQGFPTATASKLATLCGCLRSRGLPIPALRMMTCVSIPTRSLPQE